MRAVQIMPKGKLFVRFHRLPSEEKERIVRDLGLRAPGDADLDEFDRVAAILRRAEEQGNLAAFWQAVVGEPEPDPGQEGGA